MPDTKVEAKPLPVVSGPPGAGTAEAENKTWYRRDALSIAAWGAILGCLGAAGGAVLRMLFPRVLFEPPTSFKAGYPADYIVGEVSEKWMKSQRVWIVRTETQLYALLGICTHLGCTPRWLGPENKFKCPCHGSGYTKDGVNFEGPTPRPLERVRIALADDGQILVDTAFRYRQELGQWEDPSAYLTFTG
ncbi:MAG TPA: Rieske 2Fe-2S domain-containing protein [Anaeromyxobacteraceae bacterium]|nr:Rieske 2Fe-2S domain-containing protein [Anaeromyxobacteraceae bacterium]